MNKSGVFITFEGIEGSGKSKHIIQLSADLKKEGFPVVLTREPGGTRIGEKIRNLILDPEHREMDPVTELLLYLATRAQHIHEIILPALKENKIVLCDRFHDSTYAYQGGGRGLDFKVVEPFIQILFHHLKPDLTFLLDIEPKIGLERIHQRESLNRIDSENMAFHETVRSNYLSLVNQEPSRFRIIDSNRDYSVVHQDILNEAHRFLTGPKQ
ncbi:MAG: dTMP kinase [Nitrospirae bacterium]|nr:dTMP kinase [Nitrospirota bacterium]MBI3352439.1 dTMP kinase [Nitrospirota bacterium]